MRHAVCFPLNTYIETSRKSKQAACVHILSTGLQRLTAGSRGRVSAPAFAAELFSSDAVTGLFENCSLQHICTGKLKRIIDDRFVGNAFNSGSLKTSIHLKMLTRPFQHAYSSKHSHRHAYRLAHTN